MNVIEQYKEVAKSDRDVGTWYRELSDADKDVLRKHYKEVISVADDMVCQLAPVIATVTESLQFLAKAWSQWYESLPKEVLDVIEESEHGDG